MEQKPTKHGKGPKSRLGKLLVSLLVTAVVGLVYFYIALPPSTSSPGTSTPLWASCAWCTSCAPWSPPA